MYQRLDMCRVFSRLVWRNRASVAKRSASETKDLVDEPAQELVCGEEKERRKCNHQDDHERGDPHFLPGRPSDLGDFLPNLLDELQRVMPARNSNGRGGRSRTCDLRFWRPTLYQLSYTPAGPRPAISGLCGPGPPPLADVFRFVTADVVNFLPAHQMGSTMTAVP